MVSFALFFACGVWLLQQQAALPAVPAYWPLAIFALLLPDSGRASIRIARRTLILFCALLLGFSYAAWIAQAR